MSQTAHLSKSDPEALAFLRRRVGAFGMVLGLFGASAIVVRFAFAAGFGYLQAPTFFVTMVPHVLAVVILAGMWAACRLGPLSWTYLVVVDALGTLLSSCAYIWMGMGIPAPASPDGVMLLVLIMTFFGRTLYVPSPARRTAILGAVISIPLLAGVYWNYFTSPALHELNVAYEAAGIRPLATDAHSMALGSALDAAMWWSFSVLLAAMGSNVVHGLRMQVRDITKLGQYTLEEKLGEGGMGIVYRASHAMLRRPTAVKLLPPEKVGRHSITRFEREVQQTARLTHPNTVTIFDYGRTPDGIFYYAMEYLEGATLEDVVELDGPQPASRVCTILEQSAAALAEAHAAGLIHRDIKPANIMLVDLFGVADMCKVLDFGLVKDTEDTTSPELSHANQITGTPQYLCPEAITTPGDVGPSSDIYALGAVGYYLLTGTPVFSGTTVVEVCSHHLHSEPEPPSQRLGADVPQDLEELVLGCLAKNPDERPQDGAALRQALRALHVERWSEEQARSWWETHNQGLQSRRERRSLDPVAMTVAVDVANR